MTSPLIYWFRQDLRLADLPGLAAAAASGRPLVAVYILDTQAPGQWQPGGASRWWLHHSLASLQDELQQLGGRLLIRSGDTREELGRLLDESGAEAVYCSRAYEPWARELEEELHGDLGTSGRDFKRYPGSLLFEPERVRNQSGAPFRVFTPFWRSCRQLTEPPSPLPAPKVLQFFPGQLASLSIEELGLLPDKPDWAAGWEGYWQPGSEGAAAALSRFLSSGIEDYDESRNHPARAATSRLSPHLHLGEISPRQLWHAVRRHCSGSPALEREADKYLSELGWREFSHHLLYHFPTIPEAPFKSGFSHFPWLAGGENLTAWQRGLTGYPIVDAGMRELWQTGYMHNRVRMIAASFLTKHLLIPWQQGERWFWDTLVDADLANNACGWQWVAGSGADAAPYFRIFNPTLQGKKFDGAGSYVRQWVPELAQLPDKHLHEPAAAPAGVLSEAGVSMGESYPWPIVDHRTARETALQAYSVLREQLAAG